MVFALCRGPQLLQILSSEAREGGREGGKEGGREGGREKEERTLFLSPSSTRAKVTGHLNHYL